MTATNPRAEMIAGLRMLADFYEQHPEMPIPSWPKFEQCITADDDAAGLAEMARIGMALGIEPKTSATDHTTINRKFRGVEYRAYYVAHHRMAEHADEQSYTGNIRATQPSAIDGEVVDTTRALPATSSSANSLALLAVTR